MPDGMVSRTPINLTRSAFNQILNTETVGRTAMAPASRSNAAHPLACRVAARARIHQFLALRGSRLRRATNDVRLVGALPEDRRSLAVLSPPGRGPQGRRGKGGRFHNP